MFCPLVAENSLLSAPISWNNWLVQDPRSRKEYDRAVCCHPVCLTHMLSASWEMPGWWVTSWNQDRWEKHQQPHICRWYHSNGRKWRGNNSLLMRVKKESERAGLRLNILKTKQNKNPKIMASGPITARQIEGENSSNWFPLLGLQNYCIQWLQLWIQKIIASWQESNDNHGQYIEKQRHYSANKGPCSQDYGFPSCNV